MDETNCTVETKITDRRYKYRKTTKQIGDIEKRIGRNWHYRHWHWRSGADEERLPNKHLKNNNVLQNSGNCIPRIPKTSHSDIELIDLLKNYHEHGNTKYG